MPITIQTVFYQILDIMGVKTLLFHCIKLLITTDIQPSCKCQILLCEVEKSSIAKLFTNCGFSGKVRYISTSWLRQNTAIILAEKNPALD